MCAGIIARSFPFCIDILRIKYQFFILKVYYKNIFSAKKRQNEGFYNENAKNNYVSIALNVNFQCDYWNNPQTKTHTQIQSFSCIGMMYAVNVSHVTHSASRIPYNERRSANGEESKRYAVIVSGKNLLIVAAACLSEISPHASGANETRHTDFFVLSISAARFQSV